MTKSVKVPPASIPRRYCALIPAPSAHAQPRGRGGVDFEGVRILEYDAVILPGAAGRHEPVADVLHNALDRAVEGIAKASAAGIHVSDRLARLDGFENVGPRQFDIAGPIDLDSADFLVNQTRFRARRAHRRNTPALAEADAQHLLVERLDLPGRARTAAEFSGAAGIGHQRIAVDDDRIGIFEQLHVARGQRAEAAFRADGVPAVLMRCRAAAGN